MGEAADMHINGFLCEQCGCYLDGEEPGHPRTCKDCGGEVETSWLLLDNEGNLRLKKEPVFKLETVDFEGFTIEGIDSKEDAEKAIKFLREAANVLEEQLDQFFAEEP